MQSIFQSNSSRRKFRRQQMIYIALYTIILTSFAILYLTRYTREYSLRKKILEEGKATIRVKSGLAFKSSLETLETETSRYRLHFSQVQGFKECEDVVIQTKVSNQSGSLKPLFSSHISMTVQSFYQKSENDTSGLSPLCFLRRWSREMRQAFQRKLLMVMYPDTVGLALGILLGDDSLLSSTQLTLFRRVGLSHIVVASGSNVAIIASFCIAVIRIIFSRRMTIVLTLTALFLHAIFLGMEPSIVRATLMVSLVFGGILAGRASAAGCSLGWTIMMMLIYQPFLIYSIAFQLSVTAVIGVLVAWETSGEMRRQFLVVLSVFLWTTPVILVHFGQLSLVSLLSNPLLLWMIQPIMMSTVFAMLGAYLGGVGGILMGIPLSVLIITLVRLCEVLGTLPFAEILIGKPSTIGLVFFYLLLCVAQRKAISSRLFFPLTFTSTRQY